MTTQADSYKRYSKLTANKDIKKILSQFNMKFEFLETIAHHPSSSIGRKDVYLMKLYIRGKKLFLILYACSNDVNSNELSPIRGSNKISVL